MIDQMTRFIYKKTDVLLVQSPFFKKYLEKQKVDLKKVVNYPYYAEAFYRPVASNIKVKNKFPKGFNILFAGNIGKAQSFDTIVETIALIKNEQINIVVLGDGRDKDRLKEKIKTLGLSNKFRFLGSHPPESMPEYCAVADALLITLKKADIFSYTIPAKLQSYLACGKPIIGALDGIGKKIIEDSNSGLCTDAENIFGLTENIIRMSKMPSNELLTLGKNGLDYFNNHFNKEKLLNDFEAILK